MSDIVSSWSPGQAMLPPDPGGHNRMLDRGAAEHLREVAPHLAPQPERTAETCFCGHCEYERDRRAQPPAPPAEAKGEMSREEFEGYVADAGSSARAKLLAHDAALRARAREAEEREAKWRRELSAACELSERAREIVITALNQPPEHFYDKHDNGEWSAEHIAFAIRSLFRERDEARRLIAGVHPDDRSALAVNILRVWPRAEIETFARHLLGEPTREQESLLLGQLQTQVQIRDRQIADLLRTIDLRERERDEAREQLAKERRDRIAAEEALAAALRARAQRLVEAGLEVKRAGAAIIASVGSGGPLSEIEWEGACEVFDAAAKADAHAKGEGR